MATILSLDTSTKVCSLAIHEKGCLVGSQTYHLQKSHSTLLPMIVQELLRNCELDLSQLDAIAVSAGPGSYTGLRIGITTVKGLAYALDAPIISVDSLDSMICQVRNKVLLPEAYLCPMIDARRMEVYCKLVKLNEEIVWPTKPVVVSQDTFSGYEEDVIVLFGNGSDKFKELFTTNNVRFIEGIDPGAEYMGAIAYRKYQRKQFENLAYFEPDYLKEFQTNVPNPQKASL